MNNLPKVVPGQKSNLQPFDRQSHQVVEVSKVKDQSKWECVIELSLLSVGIKLIASDAEFKNCTQNIFITFCPVYTVPAVL